MCVDLGWMCSLLVGNDDHLRFEQRAVPNVEFLSPSVLGLCGVGDESQASLRFVVHPSRSQEATQNMTLVSLLMLTSALSSKLFVRCSMITRLFLPLDKSMLLSLQARISNTGRSPYVVLVMSKVNSSIVSGRGRYSAIAYSGRRCNGYVNATASSLRKFPQRGPQAATC